MKKFLQKEGETRQLRQFFSVLLFGLLFCVSMRSNGQIYYVTSDGTGSSASGADAIVKINYDGSGSSTLSSSFTHSPGFMAIDLPNNRAFVAELFDSQKSIKVINLSNGSVTTTINISAPIAALKYDAVGGYIYYLTNDGVSGTANPTDALGRVKPDGTSNTTLASAFCKDPLYMASDFANNKVYVFERNFSDHAFLTLTISGSSASVTTNAAITTAMLPTGSIINGMDYDPNTHYIYYLTSNNAAGIGATDGVSKVFPDGTGNAVVASSITNNPFLIALDAGNNRLFYYESQTAIKSINSLNLTTAATAQVINLSSLPSTTTLTAIAVPGRATVTTTAASNISFASAAVGGDVVQSDASVTDRGVVYSSSNSTPTTSDGKFGIGTGIGSFSGNLTGLSGSTTYYMRAYAISGAGTAYGAVSNFTTIAAPIAINSINRVTSSLTNASSVQYTVTFASSVTGLTASNFSLTTTGVSGSGISTLSGSGTTYTVTVNTGTGNGTIGLNLANATGLTPGISTALPFAGQVYTIDKTAPTVSISAPSVSTINTGSGSVTYTVTYADANFNSSTLANGNITLNTTGGAAGTIAVSGSGTTRTVTISNITGSGSLGISIASGTATDLAGNSAPAAGPSSTFAVTLISQHITFAALPSKTYGNGQFSANATSDNSGIPVVLSSDNTAAATISGGNIIIVGAGTANITASQAGDATHSAASNVVQQLTVSKAALTITADNKSNIYGAALPALTASYSGFISGESSANLTTQPTLSTTATAASHVAGNPYTITVSGAAAANYAITYTAGSLTIATAPLTVTADNKSMTYGGTVPTLTVSYAGFVNGDNSASLTTQPTLTTTATSASHANTYAITASGAVDPDYSISYVPGALTIGQAPLTITANNQSMPYGGPVPPLTVSYSGFVNGDNNASLTTAPAITTTATAASHVAGSPYSITASGAVDPDYSIAYVPGSLTISATPLTISADNQSMTYGGTVPTLTASYTGFLNGDNSGSLTQNPTITTTGTSSSPAGVYPISVSGAVDPDYTISYIAGSLNISPAPLTITADNQTSVRGQAIPTLTASYAGFVNGDNTASLTTLPTLSTTGTSSSAAGTYPITASGAAGANYNISYVAGTLTITLSTNANLAGLTLSSGTLTPSFAQGTVSYTASVSNTTTTITLTPTTADNAATVKVNGSTVVSGSASGNIGLPVGANTITTVVKAQDGTTTKTYTVVVTRAPSNNAKLSNLTISSGTLTPAFSISNASYTASVSNSVTSVTVTPTVNNPGATVNVNGNTVASGTASAAIALNVGTNTISSVVTAQDGTTHKTYTIVVARAPSSNANLANLAISSGTLSPVFDPGTFTYAASVANSVTSLAVTPATSDATATVTVNGSAVTSGSASSGLPLVVGPNVINTVVTAQDGTTVKTYTVTVTRAPSSNANLTNLSLSSGSLSPTFDQGTLSYTASVANAIASVMITPTTSDATATVTVNGSTVVSGSASPALPLVVGTNVINTVVTAQDGTTIQTYTVAVTRAPSSNATLANLSLSSGTLSPVFDGGTLTYTASVANAITSVMLTPTTSDATATVTVNGSTVASGSPSSGLPLVVGPNLINTVVTAQDGTTMLTYTVTVTRAPSSNADLSALTASAGTAFTFSSATTAYTTNIDNTVSSISLTPTTSDATATVTVNGVTVTSGTASGGVSLSGLAPGNTLSIPVVITAQDGSTTKTYTLTVFREWNSAYLNNLVISSGPLTPSFALATFSYTAAVPNATTSVTVTPFATDVPVQPATITVNGSPVASGSASSSLLLVVGPNAITTAVTSQDGSTTQNYVVTITRAPSSNNNLASLTLSSGTLSPAFAQATVSYTEFLTNAIASVTVTPTTADATATVKVNGTTVASGTASTSIPLIVGNNTITTVVTAQDGTTKTYTVVVTRPSNNANLSNLTLSNGSLSPAFTISNGTYTASVGNAVTSITVTPTINNPNATVKVNGSTVSSGTASGAIALNVGANTITTVVTAQDGTTHKTYTVTVTRLPSSNAGLASLTTSNGALSPAFATATTSYTSSVSNATTSITVTPTTSDATATVTVNGSGVVSGSASTGIALTVGPNVINTVVTAQDGSTTQTYTITVTRLSNNADLANLTASAGTAFTFNSATITYNTTIDNTISSISLTPTTSDATASVTVNGSPVTSGSASAGVSLSGLSAGGTFNIPVLVTAQDGSTKTYTLSVFREWNAAYLTNLTVSAGTLTPVFDQGTTSYTAVVNNAVTSVNLTPFTNDTPVASATVTVNGNVVTSGSASPGVPLNIGPNVITIVVTSQDGTITKTYTLTVTRSVPASNALLTNITLSNGTLTPAFAQGTTNYTALVSSNAISSITLTPVTSDIYAMVTVNGNPVQSGTASASLPLTIGPNTITTVVTAQDGSTTKTYKVVVTRPSNNANLISLTTSSGTLSPAFTVANGTYTVSVANAVTSITVTPTVNNPGATVKVNGNTVASGTASAAIPLSVGANTITTVVTAQDGTTHKTYTITVNRPLSSNANLASLVLSSGTLSPVFSSATTSYTASVSNATTSITATPTTSDATAAVTVNGVSVASGSASANIPLLVGPNVITTVVTAQDGTVNTYSVTVNRLPSSNASLASLTLSIGTLSPAFDPGTNSYTATVTNGTGSLTVTPTTGDATATVTVNGTAVTSGSPSASLPLAIGSNTINTVVTAQDGTTINTYTVTVTRASSTADLAGLTISDGILAPVFSTGVNSYVDTVSNATASVTVTPTTAISTSTVKVNGTTVVSGSASGSIALAVGNTTINTVVTAQDGVTKKTYVVVVTRVSNNAYLSNLSVSSGTLSPAFAMSTSSYIDTVTNATTSIMITPTVNNPASTVKVNGTTVSSGSASGAIALAVGNNTISVVTTAQDGTTHKSYTITVLRPSNNVYLSNLTLSSGTLTPAFAMTTAGYTAAVSNATTSITVTPTLNNPAGSIKVNGTTVSSGTASAAIALSVGSNTITTVVTAQDGVTHKTYTVTVTRASGGLNALYLPGDDQQKTMVTSLGEKVEANNILSPNGDGINDIWVVKNIAFYPDNTVTVYNRTGQVVFTKKGYTNDWDGTYRGSVLGEGTYYYSIDLGNGTTKKGFISVVSH